MLSLVKFVGKFISPLSPSPSFDSSPHFCVYVCALSFALSMFAIWWMNKIMEKPSEVQQKIEEALSWGSEKEGKKEIDREREREREREGLGTENQSL